MSGRTFLTTDDLTIGETVRITGTGLVGTVTKKYTQKIEIRVGERIHAIYPAEVERVAAPTTPAIGKHERTFHVERFWCDEEGQYQRKVVYVIKAAHANTAKATMRRLFGERPGNLQLREVVR